MIVLVDELKDNMRADSYLSEVTDYSRNAIAKMCEEGKVTRDGKVVEKKTQLSIGMVISLETPEVRPSSLEAENIPLNIIYEDEHLLVINKPKGLVVHPAPGNETGTLVNALLFHCKGHLSGIGGEERPGIVHRIDKDTAGLLVVAKDDMTHRGLSEQLAYHGVKRVYHALAMGGFSESTGTIHEPIGRHPKDRKKMAVIKDSQYTARDAITHFEVLKQFGQISYVKLNLETGRTHQIRVHMAFKGHPLLGDTLYGGGHTRFEKEHAALISGQCLFAKELSFVHPITGEEMHFEVPLEPSFEKLLSILETSI